MYATQQPEQDRSGDGGLPTYDALAAEAGPNSRFGRWKGWVEKRAAERHADLTPEELARRRNRGWGEGIPTQPDPNLAKAETSTGREPSPISSATPTSSPIPFVGELLSPTHLLINQFGSRFLPHSTAPINCILPLLSDRLILIGHDDGLSVLHMFPKEWTEDGLTDSGPSTASARVIWEGEAVYQMTSLEIDEADPGNPTGVILALVGSSSLDESSKDIEGIRSLRMYNLSSLISLTKWTVSKRYSGPLSLRPSPSGSSKRTLKKNHNLKGLKSLAVDEATIMPFPIGNPPSLSPLVKSPDEPRNWQPQPNRRPPDVSVTTSAIDTIDDWTLRWASDYVMLSNTSGSRLATTNVLFYDTWFDEDSAGHKGTLLAVATKSAILLYETPKSERSFRFIKEFYVPSTPRAMNFVFQALDNHVHRRASDAGPLLIGRTSPSRIAAHTPRQRSTSSMVPSIKYSNQLSLFVIFEKKAGLIRISDAGVGEVELHDEGAQLHPSNTRDSFLSPSHAGNARISRTSWDGFIFTKEKTSWILPTKVDCESAVGHSSMYLLTRSKSTHILPFPLPRNLAATPPIRVLRWSCTPKHVKARVCRPALGGAPLSFLQLIAFGEQGVEAYEVPLRSLSDRKGKFIEEPLITQGMVDLGGETAPLCEGGYWHRLALHSEQSRYSSSMPLETTTPLGDTDTDDLVSVLRREQGIYAWLQKGLSDWRVFWVGGTGSEEEHDSSESVRE